MFDGRDVSEFEKRYWECEIDLKEGNDGMRRNVRDLRLWKSEEGRDVSELKFK